MTEKKKDRDDIKNRIKELKVLKSLIEYASNRDDQKDFCFNACRENGFLNDVAVFISNREGSELSQWIQDNNDLSRKLNLENHYPKYPNYDRIDNLEAFREEKTLQLKSMSWIKRWRIKYSPTLWNQNWLAIVLFVISPLTTCVFKEIYRIVNQLVFPL